MLEIYDCTLREGEQAEGASFGFDERIELCRRLDEFGADYIELGWPLASEEIFKSFKEALKSVKRAKIVAFGSTSINECVKDDENLNSIVRTGVSYACIFGKSSVEHVQKQLKVTKEENLRKIEESVKFLKDRDINVFYDAEHFFDGYKDDKEYAVETLVSALKGGACRLILCDTKGGILPEEVVIIIRETTDKLMKKGYTPIFGVHFHDDCSLALANTLMSLGISSVKMVQGTVNGIGERIGNLNFSEFLPVYMVKMNKELKINLRSLKEINEFAFRISGINVPEKRAFVGDTAFAHKAGVHIDAISKGAGYEHAIPENFGNKRTIILNSLGGRSSVVSLANEFGYNLDKKDPDVKKKIQKLFEELKELERKGYRLGSSKAEQFLLFEKYFGSNEKLFEVKSWIVESGKFLSGTEISDFYTIFDVGGELRDCRLSIEGGPIDASFNAFKKILSEKYPFVEELHLINFSIEIARWSEEHSSVRTKISFRNNEKFSTIGVHENMISSSIESLEKAFRYFLIKSLNKRKAEEKND